MSPGEGTTKRKINYQTKAANPALGRMNDVRYGKISGKVADRMNADFAYDNNPANTKAMLKRERVQTTAGKNSIYANRNYDRKGGK